MRCLVFVDAGKYFFDEYPEQRPMFPILAGPSLLGVQGGSPLQGGASLAVAEFQILHEREPVGVRMNHYPAIDFRLAAAQIGGAVIEKLVFRDLGVTAFEAGDFLADLHYKGSGLRHSHFLKDGFKICEQ